MRKTKYEYGYGKHLRRGSITVYMSLSLLIMISLISASLYSARVAAGRTALASGLEQSLYSFFGHYDRELFRKYGLFFADGGYGEGALQMGKVSNEIRENASYIVSPDKNTVPVAKNVIGMSDLETELQGYILATDQHGGPFAQQVSLAMKEKLGADALQGLLSGLQGDFDKMENYEERKAAARTEEADRTYDEMKNSAAGENGGSPGGSAAHGGGNTSGSGSHGGGSTSGSGSMSGGGNTSGSGGMSGGGAPDGSAGTESAGATLSEEKKNLVETLRQLRTRGVLSLVIPEGKAVPEYAPASENFVSQRSLQSGVNMIPEPVSGFDSKTMMLIFLTEMFPCYTSEENDSEFKCQMEYAAAGKGSDAENLESVCRKLLAMREASNLAYLLSNPAKAAEADELALAVCSAFGHPELQFLVSLALKSGWAFAESILDVRELLDGGKIALVKSDDSWQLSIDALPYVLSQADSIRHSSSNGLGYKNYLRLILLTKNQAALTGSAMDLTEWNVRQAEGKGSFRLDSCIGSMDVILKGNLGNKELAVREIYGYEEKM